MESRWSRRKCLLLDVAVFSHGQPVAYCKALDISLGGMQMDVGPMTFSPATHFDLEFRLTQQELAKEFRVKAVVTRCSGNVVGVNFLTVEPELFHAIHSHLYGFPDGRWIPSGAARNSCLH